MSTQTIRQLQRTLEAIEAEAEKLNKLAEHFRGVIDYYNELGIEPDSASSPGVDLKDEIERVLESAGIPLHPRQIHSRLLERGVVVRGENPINNTRAHMSGDPQERFRPQGDGTWALAKWHSNQISRSEEGKSQPESLAQSNQDLNQTHNVVRNQGFPIDPARIARLGVTDHPDRNSHAIRPNSIRIE